MENVENAPQGTPQEAVHPQTQQPVQQPAVESKPQPTKGKVATLLEALNTGKEYTIDELVTLSGASVGTVKMQLNYLLPKAGRQVNKKEVDGVVKFSLTSTV